MGRKLTSYNGEDCINTPYEMALAIVNKINPIGTCLEPCRGDGAFTMAFENHGNKYEWCEIKDGIDYFEKGETEAEVCITNPPFSKVTKFLRKTIDLGIPKIVFLVTINTIWMNGKLNFLKNNKYQLQEIYTIESPYFRRMNNWRQSGFSLGVLVINKIDGDLPAIAECLKTGHIDW